MKLHKCDLEILNVLDEDGGFITRDVAKKVTQFGFNGHQHSGAVRAWLLDLRKRGLVDYIDNQLPRCWKRTRAGTLAIQSTPDSE